MATEKRLIDADALMKYINETHSYAGLPMAAHICTMELLTYAPTVDAVEVVHGCWVDKHYKIACSVCKKAVFIGTSDPLIHKEEKKNLKYCPNCGARMDGACDG